MEGAQQADAELARGLQALDGIRSRGLREDLVELAAHGGLSA